MKLNTLYSAYKEAGLFGRYIPPEKIESLLSPYQIYFEIDQIGNSEEGRKIHSLKIGAGSFKIFMWSQMHGNESTTTKAIFDLLRFLSADGNEQTQILKYFTFLVVPMLNPDGSLLYTRVNANSVDLNRDARTQTQKETLALLKAYETFKPDLCLNMHDQRTIFSVGDTYKSAIVSFLAPAADESKTITSSRIFAMQTIAAIQQDLEVFIPGHVSRFDDTFNENCIGDTFQSMQTPTILFEAGHLPDDYQREKTREYIFYALISLIKHILDDDVKSISYKEYFKIPESKKNLRDLVVRNVSFPDENAIKNIGIQYKEGLKDGKIQFTPFIDFISEEDDIKGYKEIDALGKQVFVNNSNKVNEGEEVCELKINLKKII